MTLPTGMVAVLYARADSNYKLLPDADVWDAERDARRWPGGMPVVAHPPCRTWGRLRHFSTAPAEEMELARHAARMVRAHGGVLEHPAHSTLWTDMGLPVPGRRDEHGGWTLPVEQHWWGHRATKPTWLYVCGCEPQDVPPVPLRLGEGTHVVKRDRRHNGHNRDKKHLTKPEREHTPMEFAKFLCELARRCAKVELVAAINE